MSRTVSGRPVRFFVVLMGGWTLIRLGSAASSMFWPASLPQSSPRMQETPAPRPLSLTGERMTVAAASPLMLKNMQVLKMPTLAPTVATSHRKPAPSPVRPAQDGSLTLLALAGPNPSAIPHTGPQQGEPPASAVPLAAPGQHGSDRWRVSGWLLWRDGSASRANIVTAGRLGGSQAGLRLDYDLTPGSAGRAAAYGRATAALNRPASPEGALGIAWQPLRAIPVSIAAERRIALGKGARDANALLAVGGFGPTPLVSGIEAEAYAQAGMVGFHRRDLFADGKFSLLSPISQSPLRLGASLSGGAQPGVERLDVGPEVQLRLPLPHAAARLSIEWRERVAGQASPPSGLAVTLGADF
jgi:hypothetical protein